MKDDQSLSGSTVTGDDETAGEELGAGEVVRSSSRVRLTSGVKRFLEFALSIGSLLLIWHFAVVIFDIRSYILPLPGDVMVELVEQWNVQLFEETMVTLQESLGGFLLAIIVSIPLAILITYSESLNRIVMPILIVSQVIPKIALAPLFIIWLGFGMLPKVLISFLVAFFAIVVSTVVGLQSIEPNMLQLSRSMGASALQTFLKVRLPNSLPTFFGGLKVGVTLAVIGAIVGEFVGAGSGLGHITIVSMASLNLELTFAAILMMGAIGVALYGAVVLVEKLAVPWKKKPTDVERLRATA